MAQPHLASINIVVNDVSALASFLAALDVELESVPPDWADWATHHRAFGGEASTFDADLDSAPFAKWWGGVPAELVPGVVVNLRVDDRDDVDRLHRRAIELGASELRAPWDAFWGPRYSVVLAPGPLCLGLMSAPDEAHRSAPPAISDFT